MPNLSLYTIKTAALEKVHAAFPLRNGLYCPSKRLLKSEPLDNARKQDLQLGLWGRNQRKVQCMDKRKEKGLQ